jgi:hypothetical protein
MIQRQKSKMSRAVFAYICRALVSSVFLSAVSGSTVAVEQYDPVARPARISPDYNDVVIPPNIAPLNFLIQEQGLQYFIRIYANEGEPIEVHSKTPKIVIPEKQWHKLLSLNRGAQLSFDIYVKPQALPSSSEVQTQRWQRFEPITIRISNEKIDDFLVYRRIRPGHSTWREMGIYQRNMYSFDESLILDNGYYKDGCLNCHTFCNNRTDKMLIGIRSAVYGSSALLIEDDMVSKIGTKFGYSSWHPSGRVAAYSINNVVLFFHSAAGEVRDVMDLDSLLAYYLVDSEKVKTSPILAQKDRLETYPTWSADGRYLYFCSAPLTWEVRDEIPEQYDKVKYDLVRIPYDLERDEWGELETVLSADETGLSILLPRFSPCGRWLLFTMCDYGCFPVYRQSSDLYIMDLESAGQTGQYTYCRLDINSDESESWHSWSSNGRWIAFSSKRGYGVFTRIYLSYVDENGKAYKPVLLPQKDPTYYDSCLWTYSVPELVTEPVRVTKERLGRVVRDPRKIYVEMPITMATPKAGVLTYHEEPWQSQRE